MNRPIRQPRERRSADQRAEPDRALHWRWTMSAALVAAVVVPWAALCFAGADVDRPWGRVAVPFGWRRVALAYLLAAMPLSMLTARWVAARQARRHDRLSALWAAVLGLAIAGATVALGHEIGETIALFGDATKWVARSVWTIALVWPWCLCWAAQQPPRLFAHFGSSPSVWAGSLAVATGAALPWLYVQETTRTQTAAVERALEANHLWQAENEFRRLDEIGSTRPVRGAAFDRALAGTIADAMSCRNAAEATFSSDASLDERIHQARCHAMIGELSRARSLLAGPAEVRRDAAVLLAAIEDDLGNHAACEQLCRTGQEKCVAAGSADPIALHQHWLFTRTLVNSLRRQRRYQEAEAELLAAIAAVPESAGAFHYELAEHYRMGGRPVDAIDRYRAAVEAAPALRTRAESAVQSLSQESPSCLLRFGGLPAR